ncbi:MAG: tetratricopeptide repeat protein [Myxococcota bacterium]
MQLSIFLAAWIAQATTIESSLYTPQPPVEYQNAVEHAQKSSIWANDHTDDQPDETIKRLRQAIKEMEGFEEELIHDPTGRVWMIDVRLNLARALLTKGERAQAQTVIDALIRLSIGTSIHYDQFGPDIIELYEKRQSELESAGKGHLQVRCHENCIVIVDGLPLSEQDVDLYLGRYQVEVRASDGHRPPRKSTVDFSQPDQREIIEFGASSQVDTPGNATAPDTPSDSSEMSGASGMSVTHGTSNSNGISVSSDPSTRSDRPPRRKRILPRWTEISGLVAGVGLAAAGPALWTYNGECPNNVEERPCPRVYNSIPGGAVMLGVGIGLTVTSVVLLSIDEKRARTRPHRRARLAPGGVLRF